MKVRAATEGDIGALAALDPWPSDAAWRGRIRDGGVLVLVDGAEIVGLARWVALWSTVPFLELIVIAEGHRRRGGSRRLLDALKARLAEAGYVALLSSSQTDEPDPQRWHIRMGFRSAGIIEDIADEGIGEVVFRIELPSRPITER